MRPPIYEPKGAAKEYGDYALNIYDGCPHACPYCYVPLAMHKDRAAFHAHCEPRPGIVDETRKQLEKTGMNGKTIFLCFSCDPFPTGHDCTPTLDIIRLLKEHGNHVQILTKGNGKLCFDLLDENDWYGVTIDGSGGKVDMFRVLDLQAANFRGIKTWVSFEPVLNPAAVLATIKTLDFVDKVKIGKLNYAKPPMPIDWAEFGRAAEAMCQSMGLDYYIKSSLRKEMERNG